MQPDPLRILAIDDDPDRYDGLRRLTDGHPRLSLVVATCADCIRREIPGASLVLLDYDLDSGNLCASCGGWPEQVKGLAYVDLLNVPVIVTSCSSPESVRRLVTETRRRGLTVAQHPAFETEAELRWLGRLVSWGML